MPSSRNNPSPAPPPHAPYPAATPAAPAFLQRRTAVLAVAALVLALLLFYGGQAWPLVLPALLIESLFAAYWLATSTLAGHFLLTRLGFLGSPVILSAAKDLDPPPSTHTPDRAAPSDKYRGTDIPGCDEPKATPPPPSDFCLLTSVFFLPTAAGLGLGITGLLTLALGLLGWLNHFSAAGLLLVLALPQAIRLTRNPPPLSPWLRARSPHSLLWLTAAPFLAIALAGAMLPPGLLWKSAGDPHPYDILEYHLQIPREWYEAGRILPLHHNAFSYFPFGAEIHYLLAMHLRGGPWDGMYVAQLMSLAFTALTVLTVYAACRTLRPDAPRVIPTLAAVLTACVPWTTLLAPIAYVESALLLYATLSIAWALLALTSDHHRFRRMALAGAFAGLACGVKYTAVPMVLLAVPLASLAFLPRKRLLPSLALYLLTGTLVFSPWLIRNALWTDGNPVFPQATSLFGPAHFSEDQITRWHQAHSPRPDQRSIGARLSAASDQIALDWRYGHALFPLAAVAIALTFRRRETHFLLATLLILLATWLFATHLQSRFFTLAIPTCALLAGLTPWSRALAVIPALSLAIIAIPSFLRLHHHLTPNLGPFGITDLTPAMPDAYQKLVDTDHPLALVGEAQAFWYQIPMSRLSYRTVFDVNATDAGASDPLTPWLGPDRRPGQWLLVYPAELERFSTTYVGIPRPPAELAGQPGPVVVPPR